MNLSEHFTLNEFIESYTAKKYNVTNYPSTVHLNTLKHTCKYLFEPMRDLFNKKYIGKMFSKKRVIKVFISITSGYRSETVNKLLEYEGYKPARNSQHCNGEAGDFVVKLKLEDNTTAILPYDNAYCDIKYWVENDFLSIDQLLLERQGKIVWLHASYSAWGNTKNRKYISKIKV